jgi:leucyl-tRNA synthetase
VLEMFPYPSGRIHMGHVRNYTMGDVFARYKRARKATTCCIPMGWDAFGMPAENAAMRTRSIRGTWTYANIAAMKRQLKSMGLSLDWSREFATCDPSYYQHQQKLFLDFLEAGLVDAQAVQGQLGPGRHDRARQRAGDRRPRLALRRAGRAARADAVVLQDHRLFRGIARRARRSTAGRKRSG